MPKKKPAMTAENNIFSPTQEMPCNTYNFCYTKFYTK